MTYFSFLNDNVGTSNRIFSKHIFEDPTESHLKEFGAYAIQR